jgi:gluconate 2-dehydrogenase subunit 3-like protein
VDLSSVRHILRAVATAVVPETSSLDARAWMELEGVIVRAMARRSSGQQRQLVVYLRLLQTLPLSRFGRPFTALSARQRVTFLESIERSRLLLVRRGFWAVRTLIFMGYYTRDDVVESIGYHRDAARWMARGGTVSTVPLAPALWIEP